MKIAIIEDEKQFSTLLTNHIDRYVEEEGCNVETTIFDNPIVFLDKCNANDFYEVIFLDINMPQMNGMEVAKKIRKLHIHTIIVFVTNMPQYAIHGYSVNAFDFIVKPIMYGNFSIKLSSALHCLKQKKDVSLCVSNKDGKVYINSSNIKYIEVVQHMLIYHLADGRKVAASGSLSMVEKELSGTSFALCNRCYLVNLKYVTSIKGFDLYLGNEKIFISRSKKTSFIKEVNDFLAEGDM